MNQPFVSPGTWQLHPLPLFDFQLNRLVMWNHGDPEQIKKNAGRITDFKSWAQVLKELSAQAESENQWACAAGYLRMTEFFMEPGTEETMQVYETARELFYEHFSSLFREQGGPIRMDWIPYEKGMLPCWHILPPSTPKGTFLFHGGNDSLLEEFTDMLLYLAGAGYEVLAFEGPGQGAALRRYGLTFTDQWEKPVKAVLDYYNADQVTIIGVSLGGELCLRAAAMEPRITGVVSWCVLPGIYDALMADKPPALRAKLEQLLEENRREEILELYRGLAEQEPLFRWSISHSNYAYGTSDVYEYLQKIRAFSIRPIADQIQQDVLLISARKDMLVDFSLYRDEIELLSNTRSLTFYVPGAPLFGEAHCNIGNPQLIMDTILTWQGSRKHR